MRKLVYRVQALPQSLLPLVWDFGTLQSGSVDSVEGKYIERMIEKCVSEVAMCYTNLTHKLKT